MERENMTFTVVNDEGKEVECEVLFTFESEETHKNYIVYTEYHRGTYTGQCQNPANPHRSPSASHGRPPSHGCG